MEDIGATDTSTLLQYTTNAEVSGTRGTYGGLGNGQTLYESANSIGTNNRVRGLSSVDNTRDFYSTSIPWDAYNVDRIDIQRGPNSILFGLGSPAGIVNASTRNAEFRNTGTAEFRVASYGSSRASLDVNQELIKNVLSIRMDGLWSDEKYQQKPAFQKDKRIYGALRFDPKLFGKDFQTSFKVKAEKGDIKATNPVRPPRTMMSRHGLPPRPTVVRARSRSARRRPTRTPCTISVRAPISRTPGYRRPAVSRPPSSLQKAVLA